MEIVWLSHCVLLMSIGGVLFGYESSMAGGTIIGLQIQHNPPTSTSVSIFTRLPLHPYPTTSTVSGPLPCLRPHAQQTNKNQSIACAGWASTTFQQHFNLSNSTDYLNFSALSVCHFDFVFLIGCFIGSLPFCAAFIANHR